MLSRDCGCLQTLGEVQGKLSFHLVVMEWVIDVCVSQ